MQCYSKQTMRRIIHCSTTKLLQSWHWYIYMKPYLIFYYWFLSTLHFALHICSCAMPAGTVSGIREWNSRGCIATPISCPSNCEYLYHFLAFYLKDTSLRTGWKILAAYLFQCCILCKKYCYSCETMCIHSPLEANCNFVVFRVATQCSSEEVASCWLLHSIWT